MSEQKYKKIQGHIVDLIREGQLLPGQSLPSERSLGQEFQASQIPVRRALSELIKEGLLQRIPGKGTYVRPDSKQKVKTNKIAVVYSFRDGDFLSSPFYAAILGGINQQAQKEERMLLLRSFRKTGDTADPEAVVRELEDEVDGFIVVDPVYPHIAMLEKAAAAVSKPVIALNYERTIAHTEQINFDGREDTEKMVRFLYEQGHRNIAYVYYMDQLFGGMNNPNLSNRLAGYKEAMSGFGLPENQWLYRQQNADDEEGLASFLDRPDRPTVIMAGHDMHAVHQYSQLRSLGCRIPEDMAVVGYDGTPEGEHLYPSLTTVETPLAEMGALAVRRLLERERQDDPVLLSKTVLPSKILVRESHFRGR